MYNSSIKYLHAGKKQARCFYLSRQGFQSQIFGSSMQIFQSCDAIVVRVRLSRVKMFYKRTEAVVWRSSIKNMFWKTLQNSQENTSVKIFF